MIPRRRPTCPRSKIDRGAAAQPRCKKKCYGGGPVFLFFDVDLNEAISAHLIVVKVWGKISEDVDIGLVHNHHLALVLRRGEYSVLYLLDPLVTEEVPLGSWNIEDHVLGVLPSLFVDFHYHVLHIARLPSTDKRSVHSHVANHTGFAAAATPAPNPYDFTVYRFLIKVPVFEVTLPTVKLGLPDSLGQLHVSPELSSLLRAVRSVLRASAFALLPVDFWIESKPRPPHGSFTLDIAL